MYCFFGRDMKLGIQKIVFSLRYNIDMFGSLSSNILQDLKLCLSGAPGASMKSGIS